MEDITAIRAEGRPDQFQLYALNVEGAGLSSGAQVLCYVVLTRREGILLALPDQVIPEDVILAGASAAREDLAGPSTLAVVDFGYMDEGDVQLAPEPVSGQAAPVLLMDFHQDITEFLNPIIAPVGLEGLRFFNELDHFLVPMPQDVAEKALVWTQAGLDDDRMHFYSAEEEVPETPASPGPKRTTRKRAPGGGTRGDDPSAPSTARKRVTVADLAVSLEAIHASLPAITAQLQDLSMRTSAMEEGARKPPDRASALRRPLGGLAMNGSGGGPPNLNALVEEMPPRKVQRRRQQKQPPEFPLANQRRRRS